MPVTYLNLIIAGGVIGGWLFIAFLLLIVVILREALDPIDNYWKF